MKMNKFFGKTVLGMAGAAILIAAVPSDASAQLRKAKKGLLTFEAAVKWGVVTRGWKAKRKGWQSAVRKARTPNRLARLLLSLESNMGWGSVQKKWRRIRPIWVKNIRRVRTLRQVARLLVQLEVNTRWKAVYRWWSKARKPWLRKMNSVR
jgi:hypothetical protein